jgi:hypothetical protein
MPKKKSTDGAAPLTALERLKSLNLISKLSIDLQSQIGLSDKTLTEFIISLGESALKKSFKQSLKKAAPSQFNTNNTNIDNTIDLSSFVLDNVDLASQFQTTLKDNGAELPLGFTSRILESIANGSPRMDRFVAMLNKKRQKARSAAAAGAGGGDTAADGGNPNALLNSYPHEGQKSIKGSAFPGLTIF